MGMDCTARAPRYGADPYLHLSWGAWGSLEELLGLAGCDTAPLRAVPVRVDAAVATAWGDALESLTGSLRVRQERVDHGGVVGEELVFSLEGGDGLEAHDPALAAEIASTARWLRDCGGFDAG